MEILLQLRSSNSGPKQKRRTQTCREEKIIHRKTADRQEGDNSKN